MGKDALSVTIQALHSLLCLVLFRRRDDGFGNAALRWNKSASWLSSSVAISESTRPLMHNHNPYCISVAISELTRPLQPKPKPKPKPEAESEAQAKAKAKAKAKAEHKPNPRL